MAEELKTWVWLDDDDRTWRIPYGWTPQNVGRCRGCKQLMVWCITPAGKKAPTNGNGTSHFSTCPEAGKFRKHEEPPPFDNIEGMT